MGTLTAGQPRLDGYCDHKLPTSCRLSSIGECCACYDERAHAVSYSTYIDGIGYVLRGTRWQRYCWFCKEFWENRVEAAGLRPSETRIPEVPDLAEFLRRWYEFHQGYRITRREDGTEERIAVLGEDFRDVSPGCLPRTLEEMRAGRVRTELEEREAEERERRRLAQTEEVADAGPSLDEALGELLEAATNEEQQASQDVAQPAIQNGERYEPTGNIHAQAIVPVGDHSPEYQFRRITALYRQLRRMQGGIESVLSGLRELGESVPNAMEANNQAFDASRAVLNSIPESPSQRVADGNDRVVGTSVAEANTGVGSQSDVSASARAGARVTEARQIAAEALRRRRRAASELGEADNQLAAAQARLQQLQREQRTTENYTRLFGTREEMLAQGDSYESPIGGMFTRAWERFRVAEEVRGEERAALRQANDQVSENDLFHQDVIRRVAEIEQRERNVFAILQDDQQQQTTTSEGPGDSRPPNQGRFGTPRNTSDLRGVEVGLEDYYAMLRRQDWTQRPSSEHQSQPPASGVQNNANDIASPETAQQTAHSTNETAASTEVSAHQSQPLDGITQASQNTSPRIVAGPPGQTLDEDPSSNNDRGLDAVHVLSAIAVNDALRACLPWHPGPRVIMQLLENVQGNEMSWLDRENVESILENVDIVWRCGLPAERNSRRRHRGEEVSFTPDALLMASSGFVITHDVEVMAECFQINPEMRSRSGLPAPHQLRMLYRLQRGERTREDRTVLESMLRQDPVLHLASSMHTEFYRRQATEAETTSRAPDENSASSDTQPQADLNAESRAARAFALAAGRLAMRTNPSEMMRRAGIRIDGDVRTVFNRAQRSESGNPEPRGVTYRPSTLNDFRASPSATDSDHEQSDDEGRGLDAQNTGRPPDPVPDEDMNIKMDCRICYSQIADVACLPCGHLVMCKWCSEEHSPTMNHDRTRPRRAAACPVCRKAIRQKVRIFRA